MSERAQRIVQMLSDQLELDHLEVIDESHNHSVPVGAESHFKVVAVAAAFEELSRINRHRKINELLAEEFALGMHALAIHTYTAAEWQTRFGTAPMSPPCAKAG